VKLWLSCVFFWLWLIIAGVAQAGAVEAGGPSAGCTQAAAMAGAAANLPKNLLLAIGMVESGWTNPATGHRAPWPYSVNVDGKGYHFADAQTAIDFVRLARGSGARAIDVGCFQIDLEDHPAAFATLRQAFDPQANAAYAAGFLNRLHARLGSWNAAIAGYHSQIPALGLPYARLVLASWHGGTVPVRLFSPRLDPYVIRVAANAVAANGVMPWRSMAMWPG
jgi:hypothetical protein